MSKLIDFEEWWELQELFYENDSGQIKCNDCNFYDEEHSLEEVMDVYESQNKI